MLEIKVSDKAKSKLISLLANETSKYARLVFQGVGWKGSKLELTLDELNENDGKVNVDGIDIIFNKKDKLYIHKSAVDYNDSNPGNGFAVKAWFQGFWKSLCKN